MGFKIHKYINNMQQTLQITMFKTHVMLFQSRGGT